ncbi:hypothetical protein HDE_05921 [Halotydeus destructor]|nr:hypothetical protein HDE_05921 [Halotydeus destructor]
MYTLVYLETVYVLDDICEECVLSGDERLVEMAFDLIDACQAILSGRENEATFDSKYQDSYPELLEKIEYSLGLSRRLHHGLATNMGTPLLKAVESAGYRTFDKLKEEYKFWLSALERKEHASVDRFINIKSASSFFAVLNMADYWDEDLHHVNFDHPVQLLSTFVNQASNDLFSYPKEDNAGLNPFNMIQQSIMSDKMSVKDALVSNIHRRNGYMRALELSYMVLEGPAKMAAQAPLRTMAGWERYFSHTRRYGWTNIGENTMQPNPMK